MDATRHAGKSVLVTGGGSGIGAATALRFAREGAERVYIVDRREDRLRQVSSELKATGTEAIAISADLSTVERCQSAIDEAIAEGNHLDVVISNAAAWTEEPFIDMSVEGWQQVIAVNLNASFAIGQRSAQAMRDSGSGGVILFTASISSLGASPLFAHYSAAKAGTANLVKTMAVELAQYGIRVNCISPGPTDTQQSVDIVGEEQMDQWRRDGFPIGPMKRLGTPEDMASAFSFLASEEASFISGINLVVDGGLTAHTYSIPE